MGMVIFASSCDEHNELLNLDDRASFRFGMRGDTTGSEDFISVTRHKELIASARQQILSPIPERTLHIHGVVSSGNGGHNLDWNWHFMPSSWDLVEESTEVCDTSPSAIGALLDALPDTLNTTVVCPLNSYVKSEN
jgi:hypothetical protein